MRHLFGRPAWRGVQPQHRLRLPVGVRAFDWEPLNSLKEKLPSLAVLRERFPIRWPMLKDRQQTLEEPQEQTQQVLQPPDLTVPEAVRQGRIGFGFSAGGMLFPYYIGVVESLRELGVLTGLPCC